ncbi:MAG: shikimate kinase [Tenuifilaceae bacterium]|jgi:shikimate kinase|nr:shikimate kinase [Tenuifilaceae bacterium]
MKVYLIGFMASGKTTVGEKLAKVLDFNFLDLDQYIEHKHSKPIKVIFEVWGETRFREIESEALREVATLNGNYVIASGGGTSCFYNSIDFMNKNGLTVYLKMEVAELVARLIEAKNDRPLLWGKTKDELTDYILRVLDERKKYYEKAKVTINASNVDVEQLAATIRSVEV